MVSGAELAIIIIGAVVVIVVSISLILYFGRKSRLQGITDNEEYYKINKDEDPDTRSYTDHSY